MSPKPRPHRPRKRFGQHFLTDTRIIDQLVKLLAPDPGETLVEIGPGTGTLTARLLHSGCELHVIEIDRDLAARLHERFGGREGFFLHQGDVLDFDFASLSPASGKLRIIGNLPYNISTPLIFHLLDFHSNISEMIFMLQMEVVERLAARSGSRAMGRLGLMVQYSCRVEKLLEVAPAAFKPAPKVDSALVRLIPYVDPPYPVKNIRTLDRVLRLAFAQRRKTVRNSLKTLLSAEQLESLNIDPALRPENLSLDDYVNISNHVEVSAKPG